MPARHVAGGLDAEISQRAIDVNFLGTLGSPVNPGISTARSVVFLGHVRGSDAARADVQAVRRLHAARGGGPRIQTSVVGVPARQPTARRVKTVRVRPGPATVAQGCRPGERLVGASHAFGFNTRTPPSASLVSTVSGTRSVSAGRVSVRVSGDAELEDVRALVQVHALCCVRSCDELPEPAAPALAPRPRGGGRRSGSSPSAGACATR